MSEQTLTYEGVLELIQKSTQELNKTIDRVVRETAKQIEKTNKQIEKTSGKFESIVGRLVENMISGGNIVAQFRAMNYDVHNHCQNMVFGKEGTAESGEIDWLLENGDIAILVEVKTTLKKDEIDEHIERIEKYRLYGDSGKKRLIGAVAGAYVSGQDINYAHKRGLLVIVQSGDAFKIITPPEGFKAREW